MKIGEKKSRLFSNNLLVFINHSFFFSFFFVKKNREKERSKEKEKEKTLSKNL